MLLFINKIFFFFGFVFLFILILVFIREFLCTVSNMDPLIPVKTFLLFFSQSYLRTFSCSQCRSWITMHYLHFFEKSKHLEQLSENKDISNWNLSLSLLDIPSMGGFWLSSPKFDSLKFQKYEFFVKKSLTRWK